MPGTSVPFFLFPVGSVPSTTTDGFRGFLAFWMGGAGATPVSSIIGSMDVTETGKDTVSIFAVAPRSGSIGGHYKWQNRTHIIIRQGR